MPSASSFLDLPPELRGLVYEYIAVNDLICFADSFHLPSLLDMHSRLADEYADVFFADEHIVLDAYYPETDSWCGIPGKAAKKAILEQAVVADLYDRSLASAQRSIQRLSAHDRNCSKYGVLRIFIAGVPRWSRWTIAG